MDKTLARDVPVDANLSRTRLARLIEDGAVQVNGVSICIPTHRLAPGDQIVITVPAPTQTTLVAEPIALDIQYEDTDLIVVNKPVGMVVHPAPGAARGTLVNALMAHCGTTLSGIGGEQRPGIVHRIDKDTSGLLVIAKSDAAHHGLAAQFAEHSVDRAYLALLYGVPLASDPRLRGLRGIAFEPGDILRVTTHLDRHRHDRQRQAVYFERGRHAITRAKLLESYGNPSALSLMQCRLETGRTHQIRVHMSYCGHGLIGDATYGSPRKLRKSVLPASVQDAIRGFPRQALHAARLGFIHPVTGDKCQFDAEPPEDMAALITLLRQSAKTS